MTFDEWFHKEYEPADLQIKQYAENKEGLHIPATVYLEDLKKAFEAGQEGKVVEHFEAYGQCRDSRRIAELEKENTELKSENQKWKDEWQEQVQKATDEGYARTLQTIQLTKAKEIIKYLCGMVRELNKPNVQLTNVDYSLAEAEQFLKDNEVAKWVNIPD